jgi:hypothetical protein
MVRLADHAITSVADPFTGLPSSGQPGPVFTRVPPLAARITSQQGLFSLHPDPTLDWIPSGTGLDYAAFDIPSVSKVEFRRLLHFWGYNSSRLMNDLDGLSQTLQWEYRARK